MKRLEFFLAAMRVGMFRRRAWVVSAFAVIQEGPDDYKKDPYPYRIVQQYNGAFFVDPENTEQLIPLEDSTPGVPPFNKAEMIDLVPGQLVNVTEPVRASYGNVLANAIVLVWPFGGKIPFVLGKLDPRALEDLILPRLIDTPDELDPNAPKPRTATIAQPIYVDEYLKFTNAMTYLSGFADLFVSGGTEKSLLPPPGVKEFRESLFKKYNIDPNNPNIDPAVIAAIAKELQGFDAEWLKGDDALNLLIQKKNFDVIRAKKFLMVGAESGLGDGQDMELVPSSLHEGWEVDKLPAMINNLRAGSFNRGAETMRGGEAVKWLLRASSNINILQQDCGSRLGVRVLLTPEKRKKYLNFTIVSTEPGLEKIQLTDDIIDKYMGKFIKVRSPMYCKLPFTDYCAVCAGPRLAENPTGASSAISDFGSTIMLMFMKANHGKALLLHKYDYKARIV